MAAARLVPLSPVQLHVQGRLGLVALWPLAWVPWTRPEVPSARGAAVATRSPQAAQAI